MSEIPTTQKAIQYVGADEFVVADKAVHMPGAHQVLLKIEACGICFSDTKLLHQFAAHPRKGEVASGLSAQVLESIPSYAPLDRPTVPGHEPVGRVVAVGEGVEHFAVGDRLLVQADWKHLPTASSNAAFGYNFEGGLQEYALVDERCVVTPRGEKFLLPVAEEPSAAAVGLIEPWATVEGSYAWPERQGLAPGGRVLVVVDEGAAVEGVDALVAAAGSAEVVRADASLDGVSGRFDDIVYAGTSAGMIERLEPMLAVRGMFCLVLGGRTIERRVNVDVGRVHYDFIRYCGTIGTNVAEAYARVPKNGALRPGDRVAIIGAAGPMGLMHTVRDAVAGVADLSIDAADVNDDRLNHLQDQVDPVAGPHGVPVRYVNSTQTPLSGPYDHVTCLVPVPAVMASAVDLAGENSIVNAFAGIAAGTLVELDVQGMVERNVFILGTSGSELADMATVLGMIESGVLDTTIALDAITGMAGFADAITSVIERTSSGKIMVFPSLPDLGLTRLVDLPSVLPHVADQLVDGRWTPAAESALLASPAPLR